MNFRLPRTRRTLRYRVLFGLVRVRWSMVDDPSAYALATLAEEAPEIPTRLITNCGWLQDRLNLEMLDVDADMVARHDVGPVHLVRRDVFVTRIRGGEQIPPLIALGARLHLVDGYARYRALRRLGVDRAAVLWQQMDQASPE